MRKLPNSTPLLVFLAVMTALYFGLKKPSNKKFELELSTSELTLISGDKFDLTELKGNFYIIHLFASWCRICKDDFVYLKAIKDETRVPIIAIALNDQLSKLRVMNKVKWPYDHIAIDLEGKIAKLVHNRAIPETIIINPEGKIVLRYTGGLDSLFVKKQIIPKLQNND